MYIDSGEYPACWRVHCSPCLHTAVGPRDLMRRSTCSVMSIMSRAANWSSPTSSDKLAPITRARKLHPNDWSELHPLSSLELAAPRPKPLRGL